MVLDATRITMKWKPGSDEFGAWLFDLRQEIQRLKVLLNYYNTTTLTPPPPPKPAPPPTSSDSQSVSERLARESAQNDLKAKLLGKMKKNV